MTRIITILLMFMVCTTQATNYYVSNSGNDANAGTTTGTPWLTVTKVNNSSFSPGDSILFERGGIWRPSGTGNTGLLIVPSSGTEGNFITFGAYGDSNDPKPRLLGSKAISGFEVFSGNIWVSTTTSTVNPSTQLDYGAELFYVDERTSGAGGDTTYWGKYETTTGALNSDLEWAFSSTLFYVYSTVDPDTRFDRVEAAQIYDGVRINDAEWIAFDNLEIAYTPANGIYDKYPPVYMQGLRITNCHVHHVGKKGSGSAYCISSVHSDVYIANNEIHDGGRRGINMNLYINTAGAVMQNIIIENNWFHDGWHTTGIDMIVSQASTGFHIARDITIRNNLFEEPANALADGSGEENSNPTYITADPGNYIQNVKMYNNIFLHSKGKAITLNNGDSVYIYHNTFYGINNDLDNAQNMITMTASLGDNQNIYIVNNLFYNNNLHQVSGTPSNPYQQCLFITDAGSNLPGIELLDYNLYWAESPATRIINIYDTGINDVYDNDDFATWKSDYAPFDANSPDPADPLFNLTDPKDVSVAEGSPAIAAGTPIAMVTTDYFGNLRDPSNPTIGAVEYQDPDSTRSYIATFTISGQVSSIIDTVNNTVSIVMPYGTDNSDHTPTITLALAATIDPLSGVSQDFTSPVNYTVTAGDEVHSDVYTVTITNEDPSTETDILTFVTNKYEYSNVVNATNHAVSITVGYTENLTNIIPTITLSDGATISPLSGVMQDFTSPVNYTVTAEDATTTQIWTITIINKAIPSWLFLNGKRIIN